MPKKTMVGVVVSDKMDKTVVVRVEKTEIHPKFKKHYKFHKKYKAHDEKNECREGDLVMIEETRPLSKEKRWRVIKILRKSQEVLKNEDNSQELTEEDKTEEDTEDKGTNQENKEEDISS